MSTLPPLPATISSDGSEIWDWAAQAGRAIHRQARIDELRSELRTCGHFCGDCDKWMKSSQCPMERPGNGRSVGPSMSHPSCGAYVESRATTERKARLTDELHKLTA